jgi:hypothetical protein
LTGPGTTDVRQIDPVGVSDDDVLHLALAVQQDADLAVDALGNLGEMASEVGADYFVRRDSPPVGIAQEPKLACLQSEGVAVDVR